MRATRKLLATVAALMPAAALAGGDFLPVPGAPGELRGQVTRKDGTPVTAFTVNGVRFSDPTGAFKVLVPPEGHFRVVIRAAGFAPNFISIEGAAGKKLTLPEIVLGQGEQVVGEVVDARTGMPVVDAAVSLADPAKFERLRFVRPERLAEVARTGAGGFYVLNRVPRGVLLLVVRHRDYLPEFVPVNTRQRPPVVTLHKPASLGGVVRDAAGKLAAGVKVVAVSEQVYDGGETRTDSFGRWRLTGLRPGPYRVHAWGAPSDPAPVELKDGVAATVALDLGARAAGPSARQGGLPRAASQLAAR
ncbi:MAG TPA: carboxypeptidase-like regulatory domain-containing protein [Anaeromyxobacteraceae bacterium]|nr:carboxypeptidase-like regulatory domain-containing protein [Anaeromyxobacteraceae bacterium]